MLDIFTQVYPLRNLKLNTNKSMLISEFENGAFAYILGSILLSKVVLGLFWKYVSIQKV